MTNTNSKSNKSKKKPFKPPSRLFQKINEQEDKLLAEAGFPSRHDTNPLGKKTALEQMSETIGEPLRHVQLGERQELMTANEAHQLIEDMDLESTTVVETQGNKKITKRYVKTTDQMTQSVLGHVLSQWDRIIPELLIGNWFKRYPELVQEWDYFLDCLEDDDK